jgi:hypothetical protein
MCSALRGRGERVWLKQEAFSIRRPDQPVPQGHRVLHTEAIVCAARDVSFGRRIIAENWKGLRAVCESAERHVAEGRCEKTNHRCFASSPLADTQNLAREGATEAPFHGSCSSNRLSRLTVIFQAEADFHHRLELRRRAVFQMVANLA